MHQLFKYVGMALKPECDLTLLGQILMPLLYVRGRGQSAKTYNGKLHSILRNHSDINS